MGYSAYTISVQGILLGITNNDNRAVYTGISGSLSITTAIFPLIAGTFIEFFWLYCNLYDNFSSGYDIIVFFEAYKMQHSLISPFTARIRINVAGKIQGIEIHVSGISGKI